MRLVCTILSIICINSAFGVWNCDKEPGPTTTTTPTKTCDQPIEDWKGLHPRSSLVPSRIGAAYNQTFSYEYGLSADPQADHVKNEILSALRTLGQTDFYNWDLIEDRNGVAERVFAWPADIPNIQFGLQPKPAVFQLYASCGDYKYYTNAVYGFTVSDHKCFEGTFPLREGGFGCPPQDIVELVYA